MAGVRLPEQSDSPLKLCARQIHVWSFPISPSEPLATRFEGLLAPDENDRAARFRFDHLRHSFVITRGALRCLLGRYLGRDPGSIRFNYGPKGKPAVSSEAGIEFNLTHSGDLAAVAFTLDCQVGLDVEHIRPLPDAGTIATRFFCPEETAEMMSLGPDQREAAFFRCWTRKEAYIKAIGDGLSVPLDQFRVALQPSEPARLIHLASDSDAAGAWTLHDLNVAPNYAAALAYRDRPRTVSVFPVVDPIALIGAF